MEHNPSLRKLRLCIVTSFQSLKYGKINITVEKGHILSQLGDQGQLQQ